MKKFKALIIGLTVVIFALSPIKSYSKNTMGHALGIAYYFNDVTSMTGLVYSPRINFAKLNQEITLSLGTHLGVGFTSEDGESSFAFDLPVVLELNMGHGAHPTTQANFGGFIGFGFEFNKMGVERELTTTSTSINSSGVLLSGGLRLLINESIPVGLRLGYMINVIPDGSNVTTISLFYTIGHY